MQYKTILNDFKLVLIAKFIIKRIIIIIILQEQKL